MNPPQARPTRDEVLADTEETLRAVARALGSVDPRASADPMGAIGPSAVDPLGPMGSLARFLADSFSELARIMEGLRETRGLFRQAEVERLKTTHVALREVTSQTELATTDMLDGLERSLALVDRMAESAEGPTPHGPEPTEALKDELHQVIQHLQFQDITSQRIGHAMQVLADVESRFLALMRTLEGYGFGTFDVEEDASHDAGEVPPPEAVTCDPDATTRDVDSRQALADELFA